MNKDSWYWFKTEFVHFDDHIHWIFNHWWKSGLKLTDSFQWFILTPIYLVVWISYLLVCVRVWVGVFYRTGIKDVSTVKSAKWPWTWRTTKATTRSRTATRECCSFTLCDASWTSNLQLARFSCSRNVVFCVSALFASQVWILFIVRGLEKCLKATLMHVVEHCHSLTHLDIQIQHLFYRDNQRPAVKTNIRILSLHPKKRKSY